MGMESADRVFEEYSEFEFTLMSAEGSSSMTLGTAQDHLSFPMRVVDIIRYLDESGVLDTRILSPEIIERDLSKHIEKQLVNSLSDLPRTRSFYGRETELENMVALLETKSTSILVPGIDTPVPISIYEVLVAARARMA